MIVKYKDAVINIDQIVFFRPIKFTEVEAHSIQFMYGDQNFFRLDFTTQESRDHAFACLVTAVIEQFYFVELEDRND
jgi:hypothetical protein